MLDGAMIQSNVPRPHQPAALNGVTILRDQRSPSHFTDRGTWSSAELPLTFPQGATRAGGQTPCPPQSRRGHFASVLPSKEGFPRSVLVPQIFTEVFYSSDMSRQGRGGGVRGTERARPSQAQHGLGNNQAWKQHVVCLLPAQQATWTYGEHAVS